jgi:asparagine synthase (glutamine-hydrolysing)
MCGFTGFWTTRAGPNQDMVKLGEVMNKTLHHRGPDDGGVWADSSAGVVLGSRRLAILDLSPAGHMPMVSHNGRFVIAYNGEIYNFADIRKDLEKRGQSFTSNSDTEVLLNACAEWGVEPTLRRLNGMFAFALWDKQDRRLTLGRDRLGVKPLYYGWTQNSFVFGSELKALHAHPEFIRKQDRESLALFLRLGYIPAPYSIYEGVYKLPAGQFLTVSAPRQRASPEAYWDPQTVIQGCIENRFAGNFDEATDELDILLRDSVRLRMLADVPVGAFLSGGIDSSLVVSMMQAQASARVKTFTIAFQESSHNEAGYAKQIADHLGTEHTELHISPGEAQKLIPLIPGMFDEPFADPSQLPTLLVSKLARQSVTVSLSGDGGDELFGGYSEYLRGTHRLKFLGNLSPAVRKLARSSAKGMSAFGNGRFRRLAEVLQASSPEALHRYHVSQWKWPADLLPAVTEPATPFTHAPAWNGSMTDAERMMYTDLVTYLPEDILTKLDRTSMAVSLEAREPLLDYRFVEFAWRLPLEFKIHQGQGKRILRSVLSRYIPKPLFERPKMGFGVPVGQWLRGPLRSWAGDLLDHRKLQQEGVFNVEPIRRAWNEHLEGTRNRGVELWGILMFQAWQQKWM